ncbi:Phage-related minor tail protein [Pseudovibrio axinellae]|uniref:Phage-related minor tail protein n=1 Tax=Pseudovibrio axinellae TaxID=989403 RepID=A0A165XHE4_9HYPH|nr:phage tail tape measure protein [Pseudovibrio axinellae]KZL17701.1 Phage-related minor tail protein [Pseudovibrio axinellae]SER43064.1 phage tail tape measure protein, TP901 family, core region [Pseudovibrio axinellae]
MSSGREAKLIMRLIDGVSGPGKAVAGSLAAVTAATRSLRTASLAAPAAMGAVGNAARRSAVNTAPLSAGILMAATASARAVYDYKKMGNAAQAVGQITDEQRVSLENYVMALNSDFPALNKDILGAAFELNRAGMNFEQMMGSLRSTLNVSLAGDIEIPKTADIMTNIAQAMRLPMATREQVASSMKEVEDVLAYAATKSNTDIEQMATTFKYVAPLAAATGMSLKEMAAMTMVLANNGIKASGAGTGLRFAITRLIKPTKEVEAALQRMGKTTADYVKGARQISSKELVKQLSLDGINVSAIEGKIKSTLESPDLGRSPLKLTAALTDLISKSLAGDSILDKKQLSDSIFQTVSALGTEVDLIQLLIDSQKNPDAARLFPMLFGVRHSAKMLAMQGSDLEGTIASLAEHYVGAADRMSRIRVKGIVGVWMRIQAAWENFTISLSKTGMLEDVSTAISGMTRGIKDLSKANPELLKFGAYAALSIGALAPLGFVLSGLAATAAFALNPITWVGAGLATIAAMNWDKIKGPALQFFKGFAKFVHLKWKQFSVAADGFWAGLTTGLSNDTLNLLDDIGSAFTSLFTTLTGNTNTFSWRRWGSQMGQGIAGWANSATDSINAVKATFSDLKVWFLNWDWVIPSPIDAIAATTSFVWKDLLPALNDWSGIIFPPVWKNLIDPIPWGDIINPIENWKGLAGALKWTVLIPLLRPSFWKRRIGKIPWVAMKGILGKFPWASVIPFLSKSIWKGLIGPIGWALLAEELGTFAWGLVFDGPPPWREYFASGDAEKELRALVLRLKDIWRTLWVENLTPEELAAAEHAEKSWAAANYNYKGPSQAPVPSQSFLNKAQPNSKNTREYSFEEIMTVAQLRADQMNRSRHAINGADQGARRSMAETDQTLVAAVSDWPEDLKIALEAYMAMLSKGGERARAIAGQLEAGIRKAAAGEQSIEQLYQDKYLQRFRERAEQVGKKTQSSLSVTAKPTIDTSSIDAANSKVSALRSNLLSLKGVWNGHNSTIFTPGVAFGAPEPGKKIDGARRRGGPVWKGGLFLVGEDGPELLEMGQDGNVIPNNQIGNAMTGSSSQQLGGAVSFTNHWHLSAADPEAHARKVLAVMERQMNRSLQISLSGRTQFG